MLFYQSHQPLLKHSVNFLAKRGRRPSVARLLIVSVPVRPRGSQARVNRAGSFYICIYVYIFIYMFIYIYILKVSVRRPGYLTTLLHVNFPHISNSREWCFENNVNFVETDFTNPGSTSQQEDLRDIQEKSGEGSSSSKFECRKNHAHGKRRLKE